MVRKRQIADLRERLNLADGQGSGQPMMRSASSRISWPMKANMRNPCRARSAKSVNNWWMVKQTLKERENAILGLQERLHQVDNEHTELKTTLQKREEHFQEQLGQLADAKKTLAQEFENLANKIFDEKGKAFTQEQLIGIDSLLKPFRAADRRIPETDQRGARCLGCKAALSSMPRSEGAGRNVV